MCENAVQKLKEGDKIKVTDFKGDWSVQGAGIGDVGEVIPTPPWISSTYVDFGKVTISIYNDGIVKWKKLD